MNAKEIYHSLYACRICSNRLNYARTQFKTMGISRFRCSSEQNRQISEVWKDLKFKKEWIPFYNSFHDGFNPFFVPNDLYYPFIDAFYTNTASSKFIDDKNLYDLIFKDANMPITIARKMESGIMLNNAYEIVSEKEVVGLCSEIDGPLVVKISVNSCGGAGVFILQPEEIGTKLIDILNENSNVIVQKYVHQHPMMSYLHEKSLNTIRIVTFLTRDGVVKPLSTIVRMGVNGSFVDNASVGGVFCGVTNNGNLKEKAYDDYGNTYSTHPQGAVFSKCTIPNYEKCINLVCKLAPRISRYSRLVSWDLAIEEDGNPILIEMNLSFGALYYHQVTNGPIFGNLTPEVIDEVFGNNSLYRKLNKML